MYSHFTKMTFAEQIEKVTQLHKNCTLWTSLSTVRSVMHKDILRSLQGLL